MGKSWKQPISVTRAMTIASSDLNAVPPGLPPAAAHPPGRALVAGPAGKPPGLRRDGLLVPRLWPAANNLDRWAASQLRAPSSGSPLQGHPASAPPGPFPDMRWPDWDSVVAPARN